MRRRVRRGFALPVSAILLCIAKTCFVLFQGTLGRISVDDQAYIALQCRGAETGLAVAADRLAEGGALVAGTTVMTDLDDAVAQEAQIEVYCTSACGWSCAFVLCFVLSGVRSSSSLYVQIG